MPQCTAKSKRSGKRCKRHPAVGRTVCNIHGGKTLTGASHPNFTNGKTSKYTYLPPALTARVEQLAGDAVDNLQESIDLQKALESRLHEQFTEGVSLEKWGELKRVLDSYDLRDDDEDPRDPEFFIDRIREIVAAGLDDAAGEAALTRKIQSLHDSQRKLTETLTKSRKEMQETYTQEQWNVMLNILLNIIRKCVTDPRMLQSILNEMGHYQNKAESERLLRGASLDNPARNSV